MTDYATVALRFALVDKTLDRNNGRSLPAAISRPRPPRSGPSSRPRSGNWELSAIQQTN